MLQCVFDLIPGSPATTAKLLNDGNNSDNSLCLSLSSVDNCIGALRNDDDLDDDTMNLYK